MAQLPGVTLTEEIAKPADASLDDRVSAQRKRNQDEIERLRRKSEDYNANVEKWLFFLKSYEGGAEYVNRDTLHQHRREHATDYDQRLLRAHYQNYCQPLVDFVPEYIFSQGVERSAPAELAAMWEQFQANCDRNGTSLNAFMQGVGEDARIFGMTFVQVDKLPLPADMDPNQVSVQMASDLGLEMPYLVNVRPFEVYDWRCDTKGNFLYLKRVEKYTDADDKNLGYRELERYTEWMPKQYRVSIIDVTEKDKPELVSQAVKPNPWALVPFIPAYFKRSKSNKDLGHSFLQDIAGQNKHVFNLTSLIDEFLYRQCFNILAMPTRATVPTRSSIEGDIGTGNVIEIPEEAKQKPEYISPPVDPAEFIQLERAETIQEMYRTAAQDIMSELFAGKARSGDSQKQSFSRTIPVINKTADMLEWVERRVAVLWAKMQDKEWGDGKISYKDDYSVTNLLDLLLQLSQIFSSVRLTAPTFVREEWKRVVREFDGKISHDQLEQIVKEIDGLSDADIKDLFKTPADVKAELGVPATSNLTQGQKQTRLGTDKRIGASTGSKAATKEAAPDANRRAKGGRSAKRS